MHKRSIFRFEDELQDNMMCRLFLPFACVLTQKNLAIIVSKKNGLASIGEMK